MSHKVSEDLSFLTFKLAYYILYSCINMFGFTNNIKYMHCVCARSLARAHVCVCGGWKRKCL